MTPERHPAAVILAAGASSRMGRPKPLLDFDGETFLDRLIRLFAGVCQPVIVVLGYGAAKARAGTTRAPDVEFVVNPAPERGMLSSLQCGLAQIPPYTGMVLFTPVDVPGISRTTIERLAATETPVAIPTFGGRGGHPVAISRQTVAELLALPVSAKASDVIHRHRAHLVEVDDPGILYDVDTPQDYESLRTGRGVRS